MLSDGRSCAVLLVAGMLLDVDECVVSRNRVESGMSEGLKLPKFSVGVGDRFAHQGKAQVAACIKAAEAGVEVVPVWNKSNREHMIIGTEPSQTRQAANA